MKVIKSTGEEEKFIPKKIYNSVKDAGGSTKLAKEAMALVKKEYHKGITTKEILEMSKRGIAPSILKEAIYEMDMFGEDLNPLRKPGFDLSDMDKVTETVKRFRDKIEVTRKKQALIDKEKRNAAESAVYFILVLLSFVYWLIIRIRNFLCLFIGFLLLFLQPKANRVMF